MLNIRIPLLRKAIPVFFVAALALTATNCKNDFGKSLDIPCESSKFQTDDEYFRASQSAESQNMAMSKEKAMLNAKRRLASNIEGLIKAVTDRYAKDITVGDRMEFTESFENQTREVVKQTLNGVNILCEDTRKQENGRYMTFVALEVSRAEIQAGLNDQISRKEELKLRYDKAKFERIFDEEMEKLDKETP